MFQRQWTRFKNLSRPSRWSVIGGIASVAGLIAGALALWNHDVSQSVATPGRVTANSTEFRNAVVGNEIKGDRNIVAGGDVVFPPEISSPPVKFVERIFLKADDDGTAPRVLTTRPGEKAGKLIANAGNLNGALKELFGGGFNCNPGTEVEFVDAGDQQGDSILDQIDSLHSRIRIVKGPHKNKEGWILTKLLDTKRVREFESGGE